MIIAKSHDSTQIESCKIILGDTGIMGGRFATLAPLLRLKSSSYLGFSPGH